RSAYRWFQTNSSPPFSCNGEIETPRSGTSIPGLRWAWRWLKRSLAQNKKALVSLFNLSLTSRYLPKRPTQGRRFGRSENLGTFYDQSDLRYREPSMQPARSSARCISAACIASASVTNSKLATVRHSPRCQARPSSCSFWTAEMRRRSISLMGATLGLPRYYRARTKCGGSARRQSSSIFSFWKILLAPANMQRTIQHCVDVSLRSDDQICSQ